MQNEITEGDQILEELSDPLHERRSADVSGRS